MGSLLAPVFFGILPLLIIYFLLESVYWWIKRWLQRRLLRAKKKAEESGHKEVFNKYVKDYLLAEDYLLQMDAMKEFLSKKNEVEFFYLINFSEKDEFEDPKEDFLLEYWNYCSSQNEIINYITATGENEFYKELLQNEEWKNKSKSIKRRDVYCQHCFSLIKLEKIDEIIKCTGFPEIGNIIINIFQQKELLIKELSESSAGIKYEIKKRIEGINANLFMSKFYRSNNPINRLLNQKYNMDGEILSTNQLYVGSELEGYILNKKTPEYTYKTKDADERKSDVDIEYFPGMSTDGKIYLRHRFNYSRSDINGQGIVTQDGFSVIFPLYKLDEDVYSLEVHHKVYSKGKKPWEYPDEELITLCHSCHEKEHLIHKIPVY